MDSNIYNSINREPSRGHWWNIPILCNQIFESCRRHMLVMTTSLELITDSERFRPKYNKSAWWILFAWAEILSSLPRRCWEWSDSCVHKTAAIVSQSSLHLSSSGRLYRIWGGKIQPALVTGIDSKHPASGFTILWHNIQIITPRQQHQIGLI